MLFIELCICWEHLRLTDKNKITMSFVFYPDNFVDEGFLSSVLQRDRSNRTIRLCGAFFSFETTWTVFVQCCIRHAYYCLLYKVVLPFKSNGSEPYAWPVKWMLLRQYFLMVPQADHPLLVGAVVDWNLSNDLLLFIEEIHMNNTMIIICSKMQNLKQIFQ